jgi:hypothetical protein
MKRFNVVKNPVRTGLVGLANLLCRCSHGRTSFPITLQARTYVACLECGRQFPYDWARMRITRRSPVGARAMGSDAFFPGQRGEALK